MLPATAAAAYSVHTTTNSLPLPASVTTSVAPPRHKIPYHKIRNTRDERGIGDWTRAALCWRAHAARRPAILPFRF